MKKVMGVMVVLGAILFLLGITGCGGGGGVLPPTNQFTDQQLTEYEVSSEQIGALINTSIDEANIPASLTTISQEVAARPEIESATVNEYTMTVRYKSGLVEDWDLTPPPVEPIWVPQSATQLPQHRAVVGNNKAIIVDRWLSPKWGSLKLESVLRRMGYDVDFIYGVEVDLTAFRRLNQYGLIVLDVHGRAEGPGVDDLFWLQTRDHVSREELNRYATEIRQNQMRPTKRRWEEYPTWIRTWLVSNKWFDAVYQNGSFPQSIFYNDACQGYYQGTNTSLAQTLHNKGVVCYLGWTDTVTVFTFISFDLFSRMGDGSSIGELYDRLPSSLFTDELTGAQLKYYPDSGREARLVSSGPAPAWSISIDSPTDGSTLTSRVATVQGHIVNLPADAIFRIIVNGTSSALAVASDGSFRHSVLLRSGSNTLTVAGYSSSGSVEKTITVNGQFTAYTFWSQLSWNTNYTDVDLHLLKPGATLADLWTSSDCYFANRTPYWGAVLDVDDVNGFGPEHITMTNPGAGTYRMVVHYWSDHGYGPSAAQVRLAVGDEIITVGPRTLNDTDVWEIAEIDFPSGAISVINTLRPGYNRSRGIRLPNK